MIHLLFFFSPFSFNCVALIHPKKKKNTNAQTWPPFRNAWGKILQKGHVVERLQMERAKSCSEAERQMLGSALNYRCASLLWTGLFALLGTARWVSIFSLLWSTTIKQLPLLKLTVLLLVRVLPFQRGCSSPVGTDTISSLGMSRPGWFSASFCNWVFV